MILFSGEPAVLPGEILWPGPAGAAAGGKRETVFPGGAGRLGRGRGGSREDVLWWRATAGRAKRARRAAKGRPEQAAAGRALPLARSAAAPRRFVGRTWLTWWSSEVPRRRPGIREGVVSGGAGCHVQGEALDKGKGSAAPPAEFLGVVSIALDKNTKFAILEHQVDRSDKDGCER